MTWADCEAEILLLTEQGTPADAPTLHRCGDSLAKERAEKRTYQQQRRAAINASARRRYWDRKAHRP